VTLWELMPEGGADETPACSEKTAGSEEFV